MGVPAFFRWLSRKYPSVIVECKENKQIDTETGRNVYEDATLPNPNGVEFDNLYLDMNGIIHPCTHPEDKPPPKNEDEMMTLIFDCIDRIFGIVRPKKLLYLAIDGVAPRAKMNQQRSRRFRAAKESVEKRMEIERIRNELLSRGCKLPLEKEKSVHFDSNCITPGTPFMDRLSKCLHYYIHDRLNNNVAWKNIKVILSDANVPGEGEHKIMDYIRKQRAQPDHDANTQHVLCGADADLIMLGLATHEPNFTIIREEFMPNKPRPCDICNQFGHEMEKCIGMNSTNMHQAPEIQFGTEVKYIFVRLNVLREYLEKTLDMPNLPFKYDFERALDDWVFMCFFVGNDFLPHLPSLEIREGAVDRLVELYKKCVYKTGGYLTNSGEVYLQRVQKIMTDLGNVEDEIFRERQRRERHFKEKEKLKRKRDDRANHNSLESSLLCSTALGKSDHPLKYVFNYKEEAKLLRTTFDTKKNSYSKKRSSSEANLDDGNLSSSEDDCKDEVRLWEYGFKDRYYESKFDVNPKNVNFRYSVALQYVRGLCWVLKYYYQGCASWNWYFPYHYAPFASDFVNIQGLSTEFKKGTKPFNPLEQLMSVFPSASSSHVPKPWAKLMSDKTSNIIDFYPEDFKIDLNGKKFAWQGVALLPFVDEKRLFNALYPHYGKLTKEEARRNKQGDSCLYLNKSNNHFNLLNKLYASTNVIDEEVSILMDGMRGTALKYEYNVPLNGCLESPISGLIKIVNNKVISVRFKNPAYDDNYLFPSVKLTRAIDPPKILPYEANSNFQPLIGFRKDLPRAYVSSSGHRLLTSSLGLKNNYFHRNNNGVFCNNDPGNSETSRTGLNYQSNIQSFSYKDSALCYGPNRHNYQNIGNARYLQHSGQPNFDEKHSHHD